MSSVEYLSHIHRVVDIYLCVSSALLSFSLSFRLRRQLITLPECAHMCVCEWVGGCQRVEQLRLLLLLFSIFY